ncbi:putative cytoplasmic protein [Ammonifex degensii KC4]|uniref:Cytoplasmic protein n=1 Tax=Ammonifex degensii (strain DSM 10501 / KC4) TaxID=429009 RepID=C9RDD5_AMMDK|nr:zf-TFIIB domain-containing protein [Ammonifex degensii]ACX52262.1 putative cytoplasmic protein [Ammonifex degensii KC4]
MVKECPVCHVPLKEVPRYGVLLDVCSRCRGVWLDGGELEKVIALAREFQETEYHKDYDDHYRHHHHDHYTHSSYHKKHKRKSIFELFEDLFD